MVAATPVVDRTVNKPMTPSVSHEPAQGPVRVPGAENGPPPYCLATLAAIWSTMLNTESWAGLTAYTATSMATLLLTANAR